MRVYSMTIFCERPQNIFPGDPIEGFPYKFPIELK